MKFTIGSMNKAKGQAVINVIAQYYPEAIVKTIETSSGVAAQPFGDEETREGAINRARNALIAEEKSIGIGLEGGVRMIQRDMYICNWGALVLPDGQIFTAGGAQIPLPEEIAMEIQKGAELGPVIDRYFKAKGLRQKEGAMGMFTAGTVTRVELFTHIMELLIGQLRYSTAIENT